MPRPADPPRRSARLWVRPVASLIVAIGALEIVSALLIAMANRVLVSPIQRTRTFYARQQDAVARFLAGDRDIWIFDSTLGWRTTGSLRLGERPSYPEAPPPGLIRVTAFGNSFVRGAEVSPGDSWLSQLERRFPTLEVLNYGVAAFGTDQSLLQYRTEGRDRHGRIVLIGLAPDNLRRAVNVYRRFLSDGPPLTKPRFVFDAEGRLVLRPNPLHGLDDMRRLADTPQVVRKFGRWDQWYDPMRFEDPLYDWSATIRLFTAFVGRIRMAVSSDRLERHGVANPGSAAYRLEHAIVREFMAEVRRDEGIPVIVILPDRKSVGREIGHKPGTLKPLVDDLRKEGAEVLDLTDVLIPAAKALGAEGVFTAGLHYTPAASTRIADWLGPKLLELARRAGTNVNRKVVALKGRAGE
jgi:hypothetical protein